MEKRNLKCWNFIENVTAFGFFWSDVMFRKTYKPNEEVLKLLSWNKWHYYKTSIQTFMFGIGITLELCSIMIALNNKDYVMWCEQKQAFDVPLDAVWLNNNNLTTCSTNPNYTKIIIKYFDKINNLKRKVETLFGNFALGTIKINNMEEILKSYE